MNKQNLEDKNFEEIQNNKYRKILNTNSKKDPQTTDKFSSFWGFLGDFFYFWVIFCLFFISWYVGTA